MKEWFIARGSKKFGPYSVEDVLRLRQSGQCYEHDLIWKQGLRQWKTLILTDEFSPLSVAEKVQRSGADSFFERRRWERAKKTVGLYGHNNSQLWSGRSLSISLGGALIEINTPSLHAGDTIHLHFQSADEPEASFSVEAMITGRRHSSERVRANSPHQYVARFITLDQGADAILTEWIENTLKENLNLEKGAQYVTANN